MDKCFKWIRESDEASVEFYQECANNTKIYAYKSEIAKDVKFNVESKVEKSKLTIVKKKKTNILNNENTQEKAKNNNNLYVKDDQNNELKQLIENEIEKEKYIKCVPYTKIDPIKLAKIKKENPSERNRSLKDLNFVLRKAIS